MSFLKKYTYYTSEHLQDVNMTYFQHMGYALSYSFISFAISIIFIIHALIPDLFISTGSDGIEILHDHFKEIKLNHKNNNN